jgi:hypothetical protein
VTDRVKLAIYIILALITIIGSTYGAICVFATNDRVDEIEVRVDGISLAYLQDELDRLEDKYGHTDCARMDDSDKKQCRWVKKTMNMLRGNK